MLEITNYDKMKTLRMGDWVCGLAVEHEGLYRFSFHQVTGQGKTYWIELNRNSVIDRDGDELFTLHHPNSKLTTLVSKKYVRSLDKLMTRFKVILIEYA